MLARINRAISSSRERRRLLATAPMVITKAAVEDSPEIDRLLDQVIEAAQIAKSTNRKVRGDMAAVAGHLAEAALSTEKEEHELAHFATFANNLDLWLASKLSLSREHCQAFLEQVDLGVLEEALTSIDEERLKAWYLTLRKVAKARKQD